MIVAQAGWAVVGTASRDTGVPERVDLALRFRLEAPMPVGGLFGLRPLLIGDVDAIKHNELPVDRPPIPLHARLSKSDIVAGVRIGITKAVELP
jgi:hypothetical protein